MQRFIFSIATFLFTSLALAGSSYQIDLIIFSHPQNASGLSQDAPLIPVAKSAIALRTAATAAASTYQLLKPSLSSLTDEYYLLNKRSRFQVLAHYSWRQPAGSQSSVALPATATKGWQMQGTVRVRQSNYYLLDSELQFAPTNAPETSFTVSQKQRLKPNVVYYLDHPQIGMIVKVHKIAV